MDLVNKTACDHRVGDPPVAYTLAACPRCRGEGEYGTLVFGNDGKIATVEQGGALKQQIEKILKENRRPSGYGFDYTLLTGVIDATKISAIKNEVIRCLQYLGTAQAREEAQGFNYTGRERLQRVQDVVVTQNTADPREVIVSVTVISSSGAQTGVTTSLSR